MRQLHDDLWVHEDAMQLGGVPLSLRMTVLRNGGRLWIHSPTALTPDLQQEIEALGTVDALVGPSNGHNLWLLSWQTAYPEATVYVSRGMPKKLPTLRDFRFIDESMAAPWAEEFRTEVMGGVPFFDECVFLHHASRSLILTDFVQNHRGQQYTGFAKVMTKLIMEPLGFKDICVAPPLRFGFMIKDREAFSRFVEAIQGWDFDRIIVTHGDIIEDDAKATLVRLCERFKPH